MRKHVAGFTIIELLVVVTIVAVLITILLPSVGAARVVTQRTVCSNNMRQMGSAELMYINDNHRTLPFFGPYCASFGGQIYNNTCWQSIYSDYMLLGLVGNNTTIANSMLNTPMNSPLQCPSNPRKNSSRGAYAACSGSALDFIMTDERLERTFFKLKMNQNGPSAALLGDRVIVSDYPAGGIYRTETNHWYTGTGNADGGNTCHLDGSVLWYNWKNNPNAERNYVSNGAIFNLQGWPSTTIVFKTDGLGNLDLNNGGPNAQGGPAWYYTSYFP